MMDRSTIYTPSLMNLLAAMDQTVRDREVLLISGDPGVGKTSALREFLRRCPHACLIEVHAATASLGSLFDVIMSAVGAYTKERSNAVKFEAIKREFENQGQHCLIIDEVQNLDAKAIRDVLAFNELSGLARVPIILAGNDQRLKKVGGADTALRQIGSRIRDTIRIAGPTPGDIEQISSEYDVDKKVRPFVIEYAAGTDLRFLFRWLDEARLAAARGPILLNHLEMAKSHREAFGDVFSRRERTVSGAA